MIIIFDKPINLTLQQYYMYLRTTFYVQCQKARRRKARLGFGIIHLKSNVTTTDDEDDNDDDAVSVGNL
jgi:hypothetical protein